MPKITLRSMWDHKRRLVATTIAVVLGVAFMSGTFILSDTLRSIFDDLFDDSFSALDVATDARLRAALPEATAGATTIIVAQRVSTITEADQILVVEGGEIVGRGTHDQLLATNEVYQEIVRSQLEEAEVA